MTDPEPVEQPSLILVPTGQAWLDLVERIEALEAVQPAETAPADDVHARLDRHRDELEAIKRVVNRIIAVVVHGTPAVEVAAQQLQPAPTAATATSGEYL